MVVLVEFLHHLDLSDAVTQIRSATAASTTLLADAVVDLLTTTEPITQAVVDERLRPAHRIGPESAILQTLQSVRLSGLRVLGVSAEPAEVVRLTSIRVTTAVGVDAVVYVQETADGRLEGLRFVTPVPAITDAEQLRAALSVVGETVSVLTRSAGEVQQVGAEVVAGSSLMKLFILDSVLAAVDRGELSLEHECVIRRSDIAYLSSGLTTEHIGLPVTIRDLATLMTVRSDNSAADILTRVIGADRILADAAAHGLPGELNTPFRTTKAYFRQAWGAAITDGATHAEIDAHLRRVALETIVHSAGFDYFLRLEAVDSVMRSLSRRRWTPWMSVSTNGADQHVESVSGDDSRERVSHQNRPSDAPIDEKSTDSYEPVTQFKGGSAPGVLAGAWFRRDGDSETGLAFCLNESKPLGAIEEIYAFTCAEALLGTWGNAA